MFQFNYIKVWFIFSILSRISATYNIDDTVWYKIDFQPFGYVETPALSIKEGEKTNNENNIVDGPAKVTSDSEEDDDGETVVMTSADNERFRCKIPKVLPNNNADASEYVGPSALGLLESLFVQSSCSYRAEPYWTYELCHGKYLRQYHEERDGKEIKLQEYNLGKFTKEMFDELVAEHEKDLAGGITRHPPTKKIEGANMTYHEVVMTNGDVCDLNKQPRKARVLYVCYPAGKNEVYSLKEVSTCEYEVVVLTASLCSHPSYKPEESLEHGITCRPLGEGPLKRKPVKLSQLEIDGLKLRSEKMFEAHMSGGDGPGQVKIEIKPVKVDSEELDDLLEDKEGRWKETVREPFKPLMDPQVVKEFLKGEYCLYGGSGWWKYEFCYGKKVDQYHEEAGGQRTVVRLGEFNEAAHLKWLEEHPTKRPKIKEARKQVSIFYSGGEICDVTGKPRKIEVKMKCKQADSPSTVSLYLLEPKICEYVLGVESPLVCDILPHVYPDTGLFPAELVDNIENLPRDSSNLSPTDRQMLDKLKEQIQEKTFMEGETFAKAGEVLAEAVSPKESSSTKAKTSMSTQESVKIVNGVKTITRKTIVDGVVVSSTTETKWKEGSMGEAIHEGDHDDYEIFGNGDEDEESDYDQQEDPDAKDEL